MHIKQHNMVFVTVAISSYVWLLFLSMLVLKSVFLGMLLHDKIKTLYQRQGNLLFFVN
jgi:hypothetical protein